MQTQSNVWQGYFNYYKIIMGIAILAVPQAAANIGWLYFLILIIFIAYIAIQSNILLMDIVHNLNQDNMLYSDILKLILGGVWPILGDIMLIIGQISACVAYLIIFTESLAAIIDNMDQKVDKYQIYFCTLIIIIPLSLIKKIHFFSTYSQYAIYLALIGLGIVISDNLYSIQQKQTNGFKYAIKIQNTFQFLGISILLFAGAISLPPIRASLKEKSQITQVIVLTIITVGICSLMITFPYIYVNSDNQEEIILFTIKNSYAKFTAMFCYTLSLLISYPLNLFPAVMIFEQLIDDKQHYQIINENLDQQLELTEVLEPQQESQQYFATNPKELIIRFAYMIIIYTIAYNIPNFADFLNFMGSVFCSILEYIMPVIVHYLHFKRIPNKALPIGNYIIILITGTIAFGLGMTTAIQQMIQ